MSPHSTATESRPPYRALVVPGPTCNGEAAWMQLWKWPDIAELETWKIHWNCESGIGPSAMLFRMNANNVEHEDRKQ